MRHPGKLMLGLAAMAICGAVVSASQEKSTRTEPAVSGSYAVEFAFPTDTYTGTMTLAVHDDAVSGKMAIDSPEAVTGDVAGTLKGTELALDYAYTVAGDEPCTGRVVVEATLDVKGQTAKGTAHATGCGDDLDGTFTLQRPASK